MRRWPEIVVRKSDEQSKGPIESRTKVCLRDPCCRLPQSQCITYAENRQIAPTVRTPSESRARGAPEVHSRLEFYPASRRGIRWASFSTGHARCHG
jgi:hypothetical protein